jgi:hypothetical protein
MWWEVTGNELWRKDVSWNCKRRWGEVGEKMTGKLWGEGPNPIRTNPIGKK